MFLARAEQGYHVTISSLLLISSSTSHDLNINLEFRLNLPLGIVQTITQILAEVFRVNLLNFYLNVKLRFPSNSSLAAHKFYYCWMQSWMVIDGRIITNNNSIPIEKSLLFAAGDY